MHTSDIFDRIGQLFASGGRLHEQYEVPDLSSFVPLVPGVLWQGWVFPRGSASVNVLRVYALDNGNAILERFWSNEVRALHRITARGHRYLPRLLGAANVRELGLGFLLIEDTGDPLEGGHPALARLRADRGAALRTFADLTDAVAVLHAEGMVHRSISPRVLLAPPAAEGPLRLDGFQMSAFVAGLLRGGQPHIDRNAATFVPTNAASAVCLAPERLASLLTGAAHGLESFACDVFGLGMAAIDWFTGALDDRACQSVVQGGRYESSAHHALIQAAHARLRAAALPAELRRLLEQMTAPSAANRIPSALEVASTLGRLLGGLLSQFTASSAGTPPAPHVTHFLRETIERFYSDGVGRTPPQAPDEREYAELVAADLAGGAMVWSPRGFEPWHRNDPQQARRARVVLFGRRYAYFCQYLNDGGRDEDQRVLLVKYPCPLHKVQALQDAPRRQELPPLQVMFFDPARRQRPLQPTTPSWAPTLEQIRYEVGGEAGSPVAATAAWLVGYQEGLLAAQDFAFERVGPGPSSGPQRASPAIVLRGQGQARLGLDDDRGAAFLELLRRERLLRPMGEVFERAHNEADEAGDTMEFIVADASGKPSGLKLRFDAKLDPDTVRFKPVEDQIRLPMRGRIRPDDRAGRVALERQASAVRDLAERHDLLAQLREPRGIRIELSRRDGPVEALAGRSPEAAQLVGRILDEEPLFVVQGPPGTGKTFVGSHVVSAVLHADPLARILVSAQSNAATDNMLEAVVGTVGAAAERPLILRHASPEARHKLSPTAAHYVLDEQVLAARRRIVDAMATPGPLSAIRKQWRGLAKDQNLDAELHARLPRAANVVFATCIGAGAEVESLREGPGFDWVVVEEAAHAWLSEIAVPLVQGDRWLLIGDHAQLPAHGAEEVERVFRSDVEDPFTTEATGHVPSAIWRPYLRHFQHLMEVEVSGGHWTRPRTVIEEQRRMAPDIGELISRVYYPGKALRTHPDARRPHQLRGNGLGFLDRTALVWLDTGVFGAAAEEQGYENHLEVELIKTLLSRIGALPAHDPGIPGVAILSPYKRQYNLLRKRVRHGDLTEQSFHTVDSVQGRQAEVVIVSLVRNNSHMSLGRGLGFLQVPERANVMFSRARRLLVIVGSLPHFSRFGGTHWGEVAEYLRSAPDRFIVDPSTALNFKPDRGRR